MTNTLINLKLRVFNIPMTEKSYLLLERYWPIFSWLFHSDVKQAHCHQLMKERLWFTASLVGQSDAISRKNLQKCKVIRISKTRYTHIYVWIKFMWSNCEITGITNMEVLFTHVTINKTRRDKGEAWFSIWYLFSFKVGSVKSDNKM